MFSCILSEIEAIDQEMTDWGMGIDDDNADNGDDDIDDWGSTFRRRHGPDGGDCKRGVSIETLIELYRIREDMLRGCVGLDVTTFCVLVSDCLSQSLHNLFLLQKQKEVVNGQDQNDMHIVDTNTNVCLLSEQSNQEQQQQQTQQQEQDDFLWENWFDFTCLVNMLNCILFEEKGSSLSSCDATSATKRSSKHLNRESLRNRLCAKLGERMGDKVLQTMFKLAKGCNLLLQGAESTETNDEENRSL